MQGQSAGQRCSGKSLGEDIAEIECCPADIGSIAQREAAANESKADQRETYAAVAPDCHTGGAEGARLRTSIRKNRIAPQLHQPPSSMPKTTRRQRFAAPSPDGLCARLLRSCCAVGGEAGQLSPAQRPTRSQQRAEPHPSIIHTHTIVVTFMFERVRLPLHPCPNHANDRLPRAPADRSIHAQTRMTFMFEAVSA